MTPPGSEVLFGLKASRIGYMLRFCCCRDLEVSGLSEVNCINGQKLESISLASKEKSMER